MSKRSGEENIGTARKPGQAPEIEDNEAASGLKISASRQFQGWLAEHDISLAFTTYQAGRLFLIGRQRNGRMSFFERSFNRCMGLWGDGETLYMSSIYQIWKFRNGLEPGQIHEGYDRLYVPQAGYTTGDIDVHDLALDGNGRRGPLSSQWYGVARWHAASNRSPSAPAMRAACVSPATSP